MSGGASKKRFLLFVRSSPGANLTVGPRQGLTVPEEEQTLSTSFCSFCEDWVRTGAYWRERTSAHSFYSPRWTLSAARTHTDWQQTCPTNTASFGLASAGVTVFEYTYAYADADTDAGYWPLAAHGANGGPLLQWEDDTILSRWIGEASSQGKTGPAAQKIRAGLSETLLAYYLNFVESGDPNGRHPRDHSNGDGARRRAREEDLPYWPAFSADNPFSLLVDGERAGRDAVVDREERCALWEGFQDSLFGCLPHAEAPWSAARQSVSE